MFVFNPVVQYSTTNFSPSCTATTASRSSWAYLRPVDRRLRSLARRISSKAGRRVAQQVGYGGNVQQKRRAASGYPVRQLRLMRIPCASLNQWNTLPATLILRCMHVAMFMSNAFISPLPPRIQSILVLRIRNGRGPPLSEMTSHSPTSTALQPSRSIIRCKPVTPPPAYHIIISANKLRPQSMLSIRNAFFQSKLSN